MTTKTYIEVAVDCTVAPCRRVSPFHWALLRALEMFAPGARPGFDELALRLRVGERVFLDEAWKEIMRWRAADDDDFAQARLSVAGDEAIRSDWFVTGASAVRRHLLYFSREEGSPLRAEHFEFKAMRDLRKPPTWSARLTTERVIEALAAQKPKERLQAGERVVACAVDWSTAREVRVGGSNGESSSD